MQEVFTSHSSFVHLATSAGGNRSKAEPLETANADNAGCLLRSSVGLSVMIDLLPLGFGDGGFNRLHMMAK